MDIFALTRELLLGFASNCHLKDLDLDLSSNDLGSQGAQVIANCITNIKCIGRLDISNNSKFICQPAGWVVGWCLVVSIIRVSKPRCCATTEKTVILLFSLWHILGFVVWGLKACHKHITEMRTGFVAVGGKYTFDQLLQR